MITVADRTKGTGFTVLMKNTAVTGDAGMGEPVKLHGTQAGDIACFDRYPSNTHTVIGFTMKPIASDRIGEVVVYGPALGTVAGSVAAGDALAVSGVSVGVAGTGDKIAAYALEAGDSTDEIRIFVALQEAGQVV